MAYFFPSFNNADVGYLFLVYESTFDGEVRWLRCVYDDSRIYPLSFTIRAARTTSTRSDSVRQFHLHLAEHMHLNMELGVFDVPEVFLRPSAERGYLDHPDPGCNSLPGQILRTERLIISGRQSRCVGFRAFVDLLGTMGFVPSPLDDCSFSRPDPVNGVLSMIVLHCDDIRIVASADVLSEIDDTFSVAFDDYRRGKYTVSGYAFRI